MPVHLRWELYPLAGEKNRPWGGSYLEESEWWNRPLEEKSFINEMKFMGKEVLYFKEYFHRNRSYWYVVYPFHMGIFLYVGFFLTILVGSLTMIGGIAVSPESVSVWGKLVYYATLILGGAGLILGTFGTIAVLVRRLTDSTLKMYTRRIDYINIVFVLAVFLTGLLSWSIVDGSFTMTRTYMQGLFTFQSVGSVAPILVAHLLVTMLLLLYMPVTNMLHFFAKWFTYHKIRWDDLPHLRGSKLERDLGQLLGQPLNWSAQHIAPIQSWGDIAEYTTEQHEARVKKGES
jgi:nitrate reductase gamma subunit